MLVSSLEKPIRFLSADSSLRRPVVGTLLRMLGVIPVKRPQDYATKGNGSVSIDYSDPQILNGKGTNFDQQARIGDSISIEGLVKEGDELPRVVEIISPLKIKVEPPVLSSFEDRKYKIVPKIDQHVIYEAVWNSLENHSSIGIFPEGGSHDRTGLLPLKAGVAVLTVPQMLIILADT
jgi:glycerol-3-phosphate O-acyltransferase / dihydroxyacetone phosphate acyltransferase